MKYKETDTHIYFLEGIYSNWYPSNFRYKEQNFSNSEQAFMYEKALTFKDNQISELILKTSDPKECKRLGREVKNYQDKIWKKHRQQIMTDINLAKFSQNQELKQTILNSKNKIIVEANPKDTLWGVGLTYDDPQILNEKNWQGENLQGKTLMKVREILKQNTK